MQGLSIPLNFVHMHGNMQSMYVMLYPNLELDLLCWTSWSIFFLWSSRIGVDLLSYESKTTDKQGQYDWRAWKNLNGLYGINMHFSNALRSVVYTI